jgi:hypothetical protein
MTSHWLWGLPWPGHAGGVPVPRFGLMPGPSESYAPESENRDGCSSSPAVFKFPVGRQPEAALSASHCQSASARATVPLTDDQQSAKCINCMPPGTRLDCIKYATNMHEVFAC